MKVHPSVSRDPFPLNANEWRAVLPKVTLYALRRLRDRCIERARELAQDAAAIAYERGILHAGATGARDPTYLLCGVVNGLARNERRRWRHSREIATDDADLAAIPGGETPEDAYIAREERAVAVAALRARFAKDPVVLTIVELMEHDVYDAADQATASDVSIGDIRRGRRRLLRFARSRRGHPQV